MSKHLNNFQKLLISRLGVFLKDQQLPDVDIHFNYISYCFSTFLKLLGIYHCPYINDICHA